MKRIDELQSKKLELEISELETDRDLRHRQRLRELEKLEQDILEKKLGNEARQKIDDLSLRRAQLEIKEKKVTTRNAAKSIFWDGLKWGVTLLSALTAVGIAYINYWKDNKAFQYQAQQAERFRIDGETLKLLDALGGANPVAVVHAALLLPTYGPSAIRLLVPHLKLVHQKEVYGLLIGALIDIVNLQETAERRQEVARDLVQRIATQFKSLIDELGGRPPEYPRDVYVAAHLESLIRLKDQCLKACDALRAALRSYTGEFVPSITRLEQTGAPIDQALVADVKNFLLGKS